jgi:hypothetical protein
LSDHEHSFNQNDKKIHCYLVEYQQTADSLLGKNMVKRFSASAARYFQEDLP